VKVPPGNWFVPPGNNRSSGGGNEAAEAFGAEGRKGDSVSMQAVTRVNAEQASKRVMQEPTRLSFGEGRRRWSSTSEQASSVLPGYWRRHVGNGDQMQHGKPHAVVAVSTNQRLARVRLGRVGWRRGLYDHRSRVTPVEERGLS
jgi:hypothetical protein